MTLPSGFQAIGITGGVQVVCPADASLMTPYVLAEQQDWFEDEIRFMRAIAGPDTVLIDIGANYGLYTLSIAKLAPRGRVWCYEPCSATADCLRRGIAENQFNHVTLIEQAVSDNTGSGALRVGPAAETNALVDAGGTDDQAGGIETVALTTLDAQWQAQRWDRVDIVKIDAEGHETHVINGGRAFFTTLSPLVMCEVKAGAVIDLGAAGLLVGLGYAPYRLVPGLMALAPQDLAVPLDGYLLNLFFCKTDRAEALLRADRLVMAGAESSPVPAAAPDHWQGYLTAFPYGRFGVDGWALNVGRHPDTGWTDYRDALNLYALSKDESLDITARYTALDNAFTRFRGFIEKQTTAPRLLAYVRIATEIGARVQAVNALDYFLKISAQLKLQDFSREPLLSPCAEFDQITPVGNLHQWAHAAALEAFERLRGFSGYFTDPGVTLGITRALAGLGYLTPQMKNRATLAQGRAKP